MTMLPAARMTKWGKCRAGAVASPARPPAQSEIVIIGGGANGVMAAYFLAKRGHQVTLCEKGEIAGEASGRAFGWISGLLLDPSKMELSRQSLELWDEVQAEAGDTGYRVNGLCYLAENTEEMEYYEGWRDEVRGLGYAGVELLDPEGVAARFPGAAKRWKGAIVGNRDGSVEPKLAVSAIARAAQRLGATIVQGCAVRGVETAGGRVSGVVTEHGRIETTTVLFAGNLWSRLFCGNMGIDVPQLYAIMSMGATSAVTEGPIGSGGQEDWAWRRQIDSCYSLGRLRGQRVPLTRDSIQLFSKFVPIMKAEARNVRKTLGIDALNDLRWPRRWSSDKPTVFERHRIFDPKPDETVPRESLRLNTENFPAFGDASLVESWAGAITITPDNVAIASAVDEVPGFYLMTGCAYGMTWAPALGRMMADVITGASPHLDPTPYRLSRFSDGSPIVVRM